MSKLLLTLLVLAVACAVWSIARRKSRPAIDAGRRTSVKGVARAPSAMVPCRVCGAQMDARLAIRSGNGYVCQEHRDHS